MKILAGVVFAVLTLGTFGESCAADPLPTADLNRSKARTPQPRASADWPKWQAAATDAAAKAIAAWQNQAVLTNVEINGPTASGGIVTGPKLQPVMQDLMREAGVPPNVANGFASAVSRAWATWASELRVPGMNWYPAMACYPGPLAPPMPNTPVPLAVLGGNLDPLFAGNLKASIRTALDVDRVDRDAATAIDEFAEDFSARFTRYRTNVTVTNVMGGGPVPAWDPSPFSPNKCAAVVKGQGTMKPKGFVGEWPAK